MLERLVPTRHLVDLAITLAPLRVSGRLDPCVRIGPDGFWRATRTTDGPATLHLRGGPNGAVLARAWGPGGGLVLDGVPALIGADDDPEPLAAAHPLITELAHRHKGLRLGRTGAVFESLVPTVLAQKVQGVEARAAWVAMARAAAQPAPGPARLLLPPDAVWLRSVPSWAFHRWGVEHRRAETLKVAAGYAHRLDEAARLPLAEARRRLGALPGVGEWTVNEVARVALGDVDAVSVGDYWIKHQVCWALAGEPRGSDDRMLELLEPWRGQRGRVCRLLELGGPAPPRFGPRLPLRAIAAT
jgi:3-methyladenine DNA glycosylase/8-oxoguanine DNA glycosylase